MIAALSDKRFHEIPLIIDGVNLFIINIDFFIFQDGIAFYIAFEKRLKDMFKTIIITPNLNEFEQLKKAEVISKNIIIYSKGQIDCILRGHDKLYEMSEPGSPRRCGGLGDVLVGIIAALISMSEKSNCIDDSEIYECLLAAGKMARWASGQAFRKLGRSMSALDVIDFIKEAFDNEFGNFYLQ